MSDRARFLRAAGAVAAAYTAFLLCAQFGFLAQLEAGLGRDSALLRAVLATMGAGGIAGSVAAARLRGLLPGTRIRAGLWGTAAAATLTVTAASPIALIAVGAALGAALGFLTVALAGSLAEISPRGRWGSVAGAGTGLAYAISNLPPLFGGAPWVRALVPAALCALAALLPPRARPVAAAIASSRASFAALVALFAALIAVDSAVFAHLQHTPELLGATWGGSANQLRQGAVHLLAALGAGALLDRHRLIGVLLATGALFAGALPALGDPVLASAAAVLYATGIAMYSAALVAAPAATGGGVGATARAAVLYALAGWVASAIGVGAAGSGAVGRWIGRDAAFAIATAAETATPVELGRRVYLAEGCQHCHSQYVRPVASDRLWWGPARPLDRGERPPTPGNRRIGPDLANAGLRRSATWHELHLREPRAVSPGSRMPGYAHLFEPGDPRGPALVAYLSALGGDDAATRAGQVSAWRPSGPLDGDATAGRRLFERHCVACHGTGGRGDGAAARGLARPTMDLTKGRFFRVAPSSPGESEAVALARTIRFGLEPGTMPGHEWLSEGEVADLVAYVQSLARATATATGRSGRSG